MMQQDRTNTDNHSNDRMTKEELLIRVETQQKRALEYIIDISGANAQNKSKAHTFIKSYELFPVD